MSNRTHKMMARREWAEQLADAQTCPQCAEQYGMGDNGDIVHAPSVARLLRKEHARAVRIVQKIKRRHSNAQEDAIYSHGFTKACEDILKALKEGRA